MSACFGIFHLDGRPVSFETLQAMDQAMAYWGPDGGGLHCDGGLALGSRLLRVTPEDSYERQPLIAGPIKLVARVRLDNRPELCALLGIADGSSAPDSHLILAAYRRFGRDCVQHLIGDWSFALWDGAEQTLLVARDATGNTGLYYWWDGKRTLVFSNGAKGVFAHPDFVRRPNPLAFAAILTDFDDPETQDATVYQDLKTLLPGRMLIADRTGVRIDRWWCPENLAPLEFADAEECYAEFLSLYGTIVDRCLRVGGGGVAATLSGGLDSGSVVALAAPGLAARSRCLDAYVHAPAFAPAAAGPRRTGDEFLLAETTAKHIGNVQPIAVRSETASFLSGIERSIGIHDSVGSHGATNHYWVHDILDKARQAHHRVLLTGQWGNATVSYAGHGSLLAELKAGRIGKATRALLAEEVGCWGAVRQRVIRPLYWPLRLARLRRSKSKSWAEHALIHPTFAVEQRWEERMRAAGFDPVLATTADPYNRYMNAFRLGLNGGGMATARNWMEIGAAYGIDVRDPTRDRRLVEFCWRLPDDAFWAHGRRKGLVRCGMRGKLPQSVLDCKRKGLQSADIVQRMRNDAERIEAALAAGARHSVASEWLDIPRLRSMLGRVVRSPGTEGVDLDAVHYGARGLSVAMFLAGLPIDAQAC